MPDRDGNNWPMKTMTTCVAVAIVALGCVVGGRSGHADPAPAPAREHVAPGSGRTAASRTCDSTEDCVANTACVRGGTGGYVCTPLCATDADCHAAPSVSCQGIVDAGGKDYAERVCSESRATLASMLSVRGSAPGGVASWWELGVRTPEADVLRLKVAVRVPFVRDLIKARLLAAAQAAIANQLGSVSLINVRYSGFSPTVDRVGISRAQHDDQVRVLVSGSITAARERLVVSWSGTSWEADGTEDIASYHAELLVTTSITPAPKLVDQHLKFDIALASSSITINLSPLDGTVIANAFTFDPPPPVEVPLGTFATTVPDRLQAAVVRWIRFGAIDDKELVLEARAE